MSSFKYAQRDWRDASTLLGSPYFTWMTTLIDHCQRAPLELADLFALDRDLGAEDALLKFQHGWRAEVHKHGKDKASLVRVIFAIYWRDMMFALLLMTVGTAFFIIGPAYFVRALINYSSSEEADLAVGLPLVLGLFLNESLRSVFVNQYWYQATRVSAKARAAVAGIAPNPYKMTL
jgi:hypothetical protein